MSVGDLATTRNAPPVRIVLAGNVKSISPDNRYPLMSSKNGLELNNSTYSSAAPSVHGAGLYMISEMTRPVLRLEGPSGSQGSVSGPPPVAAVSLRSPVGPSLAARDCRAEANEKRTATSQSGFRRSFCLMVCSKITSDFGGSAAWPDARREVLATRQPGASPP